jgi:hypothetical protein
VGHPPSAAFVPLLDDVSSRARTELGDIAFDAALDEGRGWSTVDALDRVLDELSREAGTGGRAPARPPTLPLSPP